MAVNTEDQASDIALEKRPAAFDPFLVRQLREDSAAQAKNKAYIVGLDFDPFLASQDPCERYDVVKIRLQGQSYMVDVRGSGGCEKHDQPNLTAEIIHKNGAWLFVNFHYPGPYANDLISILKKLRSNRQIGVP